MRSLLIESYAYVKRIPLKTASFKSPVPNAVPKVHLSQEPSYNS